MSKPFFIVVALVLALGAASHQTWQVHAGRQQVAALQQEAAGLEKELQHVRVAHDKDARCLKQVQKRLARQQTETQSAAQSSAGTEGDPSWASEYSMIAAVERLCEWFAKRPGSEIPELELLKASDWLLLVQLAGNTANDEEVRKTLAGVRSVAKRNFQEMLQEALRSFAKANNGQELTEVSQLCDYFKEPVDEAMLQRYRVIASKALPDELQNHDLFPQGTESVVIEKQAVDPTYDALTITSERAAWVHDGEIRVNAP